VGSTVIVFAPGNVATVATTVYGYLVGACEERRKRAATLHRNGSLSFLEHVGEITSRKGTTVATSLLCILLRRLPPASTAARESNACGGYSKDPALHNRAGLKTRPYNWARGLDHRL
jgi:hypothetical protein